jgi:hypothetical protein
MADRNQTGRPAERLVEPTGRAESQICDCARPEGPPGPAITVGESAPGAPSVPEQGLDDATEHGGPFGRGGEGFDAEAE